MEEIARSQKGVTFSDSSRLPIDECKATSSFCSWFFEIYWTRES